MKSTAILFALVATFTPVAFSQIARPTGACPTAASTLTVGAFAGASYLKPDEGSYYNLFQTGYVLGADVTRNFGRTSISIEPTLGRSKGKDTSLNYFLGDGLVSRAIGPEDRIHPFGMLGVGYGTIDYPGGKNDDSVIRNLGLGIGYDVADRVAVRAAWVYQSWNLGHQTPGFNPNGIEASVLFRLGFGFKRQRP